MNYVDHFNLFGVDAKQIPCDTGEGAPTTATVGPVGGFYMDTLTGDVYKCVSAVDGVYGWELFGDNFREIQEFSHGVLSSFTGDLENYADNSRLYTPDFISIRNGDKIIHDSTTNNYKYSLRFYDNDGNYKYGDHEWFTGNRILGTPGRMRMCVRKTDNSIFMDDEKSIVRNAIKLVAARADDIGVFSVNGVFPDAEGNVDITNNDTILCKFTMGSYWNSGGGRYSATTRGCADPIDVTKYSKVTLADTEKSTYRFGIQVFDKNGLHLSDIGWTVDDYVVKQPCNIRINIKRVDEATITQSDIDTLSSSLVVCKGKPEEAREDLLQSITLEFNRIDDTSYQLARIPMTTNGGRSVRPVVRLTSVDGSLTGTKCSTLNYAKRENTAFAMNAGLFNVTTLQPAGQTIIDGASIVNTPMTSDNGIAISDTECYPVCIDEDGWLSAPYPRTVDTATMLADGVVQAVTGWITIVDDYAVASDEIATEIVHPQRYVQNVIGQFDNGDYIVCSVSNKGYGTSAPNDNGFTYTQVAQILVDKGVKFAYALDGGGSAQTVIGKRHINPIYEGTAGRAIPAVLIFEAY